MTLSEELSWRGFANQTTYKDIKVLDGPSLTFYWGVDPSADSMTVGHLAPAMMVKHFIDHGHKAILLVGGATGMIGDPDGKKQERELKTEDEIVKNKASIVEQYKRIFAGASFEVVDNYDWFKDFKYLTFLRDIGKHVSMTQMLDREFIRARIGEGGEGISYAEFSYSLIQGYDFLHLFREKGATLQVAGADQWGNSITGVQLIRRIEGAEAHVFTTPLIINKSTGVKFGKSEDGALWLDEKKTSVYSLYQFWLNMDDESVFDYLKIYTMLTKEEIDQLQHDQQEHPEQRVPQKRLAYEVTKVVHGEERAKSAQIVTETLFGNRKVQELAQDQLTMLSAEIPTAKLGQTIVEILCTTGTTKTNAEAKRLITAGAVSLNGEKIFEDSIVSEKKLLKKGKNTFILVH